MLTSFEPIGVVPVASGCTCRLPVLLGGFDGFRLPSSVESGFEVNVILKSSFGVKVNLDVSLGVKVNLGGASVNVKPDVELEEDETPGAFVRTTSLGVEDLLDARGEAGV